MRKKNGWTTTRQACTWQCAYLQPRTRACTKARMTTLMCEVCCYLQQKKKEKDAHTHIHTHLWVISNVCDASGWLIDTTDTKTSAVLALLPSLCLTVNSNSVNILHKNLFLHTVNCLCCPVYLFTCSNTYRIYSLGRRAFAVCVTERRDEVFGDIPPLVVIEWNCLNLNLRWVLVS